ncbi:hypothetical protein T439DRAFT_297773 [Meredithblackwellia eburnea MCA 4105]
MASKAEKIASLQSRILKERKILEGFQALHSATTNTDVKRNCEAKIRETGRTIGWFEESLRELGARDTGAPGGGGGTKEERGLPPPPPGAAPSNWQWGQQHGAMDGQGGTMMGPGQQSGGGGEGKAQKVNYTSLDLIKADTPLTSAKISRMLHQLEFKLHVEKQYKEGIDKMSKLYLLDGDKKARADTENKRIESNQKMMLLNQALKRYKTLDILGELGEEADDSIPDDLKSNLRKPLSGALQITIKSARDLAHAPQPKKSKHPSETVIYVKVEDTPRARTHPSRTDRWNEDFEIHVDKANEVEVTIYDKVPGEGAPVPVGMLWLRLSDLVEELRRRKMGAEAGPGWVTAARVQHNGSSSSGAGFQQTGEFGGMQGQGQGGFGPPGAQGFQSQNQQGQSGGEGVDAWFAVEPEGALCLHLNFVKSNVRKRPYDAGGLGRQGAVRKRKEEVHEQNGHKFVQKQFYTVVLCALCGEFLLKGAGMQCEDCNYACHKNCYTKVVTKCISKSNADTDKDEDQLNHRIPHRFEALTNVSPNWCCHCGMVLPLGRKNARKCSECGITAHTDCVHLVPDFCGMSMEMANKLLADIKSINNNRRPGQQQQPTRPRPPQAAIESLPPPPPAPPTPNEYLRTDLSSDVGRLSIHDQSSARPYPTPPSQPAQPQPHTSYYEQQQRPPSQPPVLPHPTQQDDYRRPPPASVAPQVSAPGPSQQQLYLQQQQQQQMAQHQQQQQQMQQQQQLQQQQLQQQQRLSYSVGQVVAPLPTKIPAQAVVSAPAPSPYAQQQQQQQPQYQQQPPPPGPPGQPDRRAPPRQRRIGLDDFNFLAVLGKGNFGKVMLAEEKRTSQLYAIKVLKKEFIIENDEVESTKSEKRVFLAAARERHPFLLGLHSCFQTETRIYFVMEYVSGGDLMLHIQREQFTPRRAKFYAAEVLLALEYFHQNGIVYRDLKLDNILLTLDGHVKVADYGLCKEEMWFGSTTSTFCGTPEFMAPEIILEQRYGRAVDWWAFGVLIYEMLLGQSPFRGEDEDEIFDAILEDEPLYPIHMPKDSVSILQKLLTRDPARRLGSGETDAQEIRSHQFFRDTNWDDILHKRVPPPFFPTIASATDTSNFDSEFTNEQPRLTPIHSTLTDADQRDFTGFSWTAPWVPN